MREFKMIKTSEKDAERIMNEMAKEGWDVAAVTYYSYWWISVLITFRRER